MDGWPDGQMDGRTDRQMDGQTDRHMDKLTDGQTERQQSLAKLKTVLLNMHTSTKKYTAKFIKMVVKILRHWHISETINHDNFSIRKKMQ